MEGQLAYEGYIYAIGEDLGELELGEASSPRCVKVRLRGAATRLRKEIEVRDAEGQVYFKVGAKRDRRGKSS